MKTQPLTPYQMAQLFSVLVKRKIFVEPRHLPDNSIEFSAAAMKIASDAVAAERWERDHDQNRRPTQWDAGLEWLVKLVNHDEPDIP